MERDIEPWSRVNMSRTVCMIGKSSLIEDARSLTIATSKIKLITPQHSVKSVALKSKHLNVGPVKPLLYILHKQSCLSSQQPPRKCSEASHNRKEDLQLKATIVSWDTVKPFGRNVGMCSRFAGALCHEDRAFPTNWLEWHWVVKAGTSESLPFWLWICPQESRSKVISPADSPDNHKGNNAASGTQTCWRKILGQ